jgi:protein O-mannosyl-transferase
MADRFTYVPLIGLFIMVAWGVPDLLVRWPLRRIDLPSFALPAAAALVILVCAVAARGQLQYWENSTTLWTRTLAVTTGNNIAHNNLGVILADQGKLDEAIAHYSEALRIKPNYADAHNNLGVALDDQGKTDQAIAQYSEALRIRPDYANAHINLGIALASQGNLDEAISHFTEALRIEPDSAKAHNDLGIALASEGNLDEAIAHFTEALRIKPDYADAHNNLQVALDRRAKGTDPATPSGAGLPR